MATTQKTTPIDQRIVLYDVPWEMYERLLANYEDKSSPRFTYDRGVLEIVSPTTRHERIIYALTTIVTLTALQSGLDADGVGSTTYKRADMERGFEPDASFYIQHAAKVSDTAQIDLTVDPPPDLVIEIDIANSSLNKLPIYAQMGVPEVWRYEEVADTVVIFQLREGNYQRSTTSGVLPPASDTMLTRFVHLSRTVKSSKWLAELQTWLREVRDAQV